MPNVAPLPGTMVVNAPIQDATKTIRAIASLTRRGVIGLGRNADHLLEEIVVADATEALVPEEAAAGDPINIDLHDLALDGEDGDLSDLGTLLVGQLAKRSHVALALGADEQLTPVLEHIPIALENGAVTVHGHRLERTPSNLGSCRLLHLTYLSSGGLNSTPLL